VAAYGELSMAAVRNVYQDYSKVGYTTGGTFGPQAGAALLLLLAG
jgi:hypothetical protein